MTIYEYICSRSFSVFRGRPYRFCSIKQPYGVLSLLSPLQAIFPSPSLLCYTFTSPLPLFTPLLSFSSHASVTVSLLLLCRSKKLHLLSPLLSIYLLQDFSLPLPAFFSVLPTPQYLTLFLSPDSCELQHPVSRMSNDSHGAGRLCLVTLTDRHKHVYEKRNPVKGKSSRQKEALILK